MICCRRRQGPAASSPTDKETRPDNGSDTIAAKASTGRQEDSNSIPRLFCLHSLPSTSLRKAVPPSKSKGSGPSIPPPPAPQRPDVPVVLLHGFLGSHRYMCGIQKALNTVGYEVYSLDLLGFGRSPKWNNDFGFDTEAQLKALSARISELELKRFLVVGHSLGALLGLKLLEQDSKCVGCVAISTPAFPSTSAFFTTARRSSLLGWSLMKAPRFVTRPLCWSVCQQSWFWKPLAIATLEPLLRIVLTLDLAGILIEDFFLHSHDSCAMTFEECLVPLSVGSLDFAKGSGLKNTVFLHGSIDQATPVEGLARKLGDDFAARQIRMVEGADHFRILKHTDKVVAACERLRSRAATEASMPASAPASSSLVAERRDEGEGEAGKVAGEEREEDEQGRGEGTIASGEADAGGVRRRQASQLQPHRVDLNDLE